MRASKLYAVAAIAVSIVIAGPALAQFAGPVLPLSTTLVLEKPAANQTVVDSRHAIDIGFKNQTLRFILRDAYVDNPTWVWSDIWQSIRQFRPNMQILDSSGDALLRLRPGDIVTLKGMYTMRTRVLVVSQVQPGGGESAPKHSY